MAKELLSAKVEGDIKEKIGQLTEKYKDQGLIVENGDLYNLAADLLERNLNVQTPRHVVGIDQLDQLTAQINRLFIGMIDQNNISMETMRVEFEKKYENAKMNVDSLLVEKQELKDQLTESGEKIKELTQLTRDNQEESKKLLTEIEEKNKYTRLLENQIEGKDLQIKQLEQFEKQNKELLLDSKQKHIENQDLFAQIAQLKSSAEKVEQSHKSKIKELDFEKKEAVFNKEKELNEQYNKELSEIRNKQAEILDKHEDRVAVLQEKYNAALSEKEHFKALYEALRTSVEKQKEDKPGKEK